MRDAIKSLGDLPMDQDPHRGLVLDTFLRAHGDENAKRNLMDSVAGSQVPKAYAGFYNRWRAAQWAAGAVIYKGERRSPVLVGLGDESVSEVHVTLHRTYGVPYLPGSALKGLAASYARKRLDPAQWGPSTDAYRVLFGNTDEAGYVVFHDALMIPDRERGDLKRDVLTVHHQKYYGKESVPPADWDSPIPVPMLVAHANFAVPLAGPEAWRLAAHRILKLALDEEGIGAKTSSGYGRIDLQGPIRKPREQAADQQAAPPTPTSGMTLAEQLAAKLNTR